LCGNLNERGLELLEMMLVFDPAGRISAKQSCNHPYFEEYHAQQDAAATTTYRGNGYYR
jgi:cyclin-dependent kinase